MDTDGYAANLIAKAVASILQEISSATCDCIDDDIDILCASNPSMLICEVFDGLLQIAVLILLS
jgi:hypothetical protein